MAESGRFYSIRFQTVYFEDIRTPVSNLVRLLYDADGQDEAVSTVAVFRKVKTDSGWTHYPAVYSANGRDKPGRVSIKGMEASAPTEGYYELRWYEKGKVKYEHLRACRRQRLSPAARSRLPSCHYRRCG